ncbi:MAG: PilZ domain-containing protein [Spirochaetes bacterium]|nr:PilZ domain-containing protein [Spirochaetota bacterium]
MILLVTKYKFLATPDTKSMWIFAIVVAVFVILLFIGNFISAKKTSKTPAQRKRYSRYIFKQMARSMGLQKSHIEILEHLVKATKVKQPMLVFSSAGLLDDVLKKGLYSLQRRKNTNEETKEKNISQLFQIKQIIERNSKNKIGIKSSHLVKPGQSVVMLPEHGGQYPGKVLSNLRDMLACTIAKDGSGGELRWKRGTKLKVIFWREHDAGYSFLTKVLGYDAIKGQPAVFIQHSKTLRREQQRKFRRKPLERPCFFFPIKIIELGEGRRAKKRAVVQNNQRILGTIIDISAGGCSIRTLTPLNRGSLVKIEFDIDRKLPITAFGKVRRVRKEEIRGGIMHVMFTRVSGKNLNEIYSYVYNYTPPANLAKNLIY